MVNKQIRILFVEDKPEDAVRVDHALDQSGLVFQFRQVETREDFLHELQLHPPDVILSDHGLPRLNGLTALAIAREKCPEVPFIFVTGALGEEVAIETFENGATDYILKNQLDNLGPAVHRALETAEERRLRRLLEHDREQLIQELNEALAKVRTLSGLLCICSECKKIRDEQMQWVPLEQFFEGHLNLEFSHGLCPQCLPRYFSQVEKIASAQ